MIPAPAEMRRAIAGDGTAIAYHLEPVSAGAPTFVFAHATGFCAAVWAPVLSRLRELVPGSGIVAADQRSHGASDSSEHPFDWWDIGADLLAVLADVAVTPPLVGVGHSGGGAGVALAELTAPGTFDAMLLIEPILLPPPFVRHPELSIAMRAERRRRWFPSRDVARSRWAGKPPFDKWVEAAFAGYLAHGLVDGRDEETGADGVVLACAPGDEAEWFWAGDEHGGWARCAELEVPAVIMAGTASDTHGDGLANAIADRMPQATVRMLDGADHFIPMTHPDVVAEAAADLIR